MRFAGFALSVSLIGSVLILTSTAPLSPLVPLAEEKLSQALGGPVALSGLRLRSTERAVELRFDELRAEGPSSFTARQGVISLTLGRLFNLQPVPRRVRIADVTGSVQATANTGSAPPNIPIERLLTALATGEAGDASLPSVSIEYLGTDGQELFTLSDAAFAAEMGDGGYGIEAGLPFVLADGSRVEAGLEVLIAPDGETSLSFVSNGAPIQPLLTAFGVDAFSMESSLDGSVALTVGSDGEPRGGSIDVRLAEGSGALAGESFELGNNVLRATFSEAEPVFRIETLSYDLAGNRGELSGSVGTENLLDPVELVLDFDVAGRDIHLDLGNFMEGPLDVEAVRAAGRFDAAERRLVFEELRSSFFSSELRGSLALTFPEGFQASPRIESEAVLPGPLTPQEVLAGWPRALAEDARNWVVENLRTGRLTNLAYVSDIPMGAIRKGEGLSDDMMTFTFDADEARVSYLSGMPPITDLSASAMVRGNSFSVEGRSGMVGGVRVEDAELLMPRFKPAGARASFTGTLRGEIPTILETLEASKLVDFSEGAYTTDSFHGLGSFDLEVSWPIRDVVADGQVYFGGEGAFARGGIDNVVPGIDATDAGGRVSLSPERILIRGDGLAAQAPTTFEWRQALKGEQKAELAVTAELDTLAADMIGFPLRQFFRGEVQTQIYADDLSPGAPLTIIGELTDAAVNIPMLGVRKPRGVPGFFETTVALPETEAADGTDNVTLEELRLTSSSFNIEGTGTFTPEGGVVRLELPRLFIDGNADLSLRLITDEDGIHLDLDGEHASAVTAIDSFFASSNAAGGNLPGTADVEVSLRRLSLKNGVEMQDVTASGYHTGEAVEQFTLQGELGAEEVMSVTLDRPPGSELGFVEIEATNFGTLMNGIFGVSSVSGGAGSIKGTTLPEQGFVGRFEMGELIIQDAPTLARILSFTSLDGLADALAGEGIRFTRLEGDLAVNGGQIGISDAKLVGSSLGISASGEVDLDRGTIDLRGAFAPAYAVNSFLGALPGIGQLLTSRDGEGIVAFSYAISGPIEQPVITVNALSALTPGILRRLFDPLPDTDEALERATGEIERQRDLSEAP